MRNWGRKQLQSRSVVAVVGVGAHKHTDRHAPQFALGERERRKTEMGREKIVSCRLAKLHIRRTWARANSHHTLLHGPFPTPKQKGPTEKVGEENTSESLTIRRRQFPPPPPPPPSLPLPSSRFSYTHGKEVSRISPSPTPK